MADYPWYCVVGGNEDLNQGDFVSDCPIYTLLGTDAEGKPEFEVDEYNVVILSQSCDLEHQKIELVQVCPISPFDNSKHND